MESWNSADILLCLTPILFLEFNIARLVLGLGDDVSALDHMCEMLKSLPGMCCPIKSRSGLVIDVPSSAQIGVLSVEAGLLSPGVIFLVKSRPDLMPTIPTVLQSIVHVQVVELPLKPRSLVYENDEEKFRTLPTRAKRPPKARRQSRILKNRHGEMQKVKKAVIQKGKKELEKTRWMKMMRSRL